MEIWLILILCSAIFPCIPADTKILREINILSDNANRTETFLLKNENFGPQELIIKGNLEESIYPKDSSDYVYYILTIYVADKNGYRVKYKLIRQRSRTIVLHLNPSTLKSLSG